MKEHIYSCPVCVHDMKQVGENIFECETCGHKDKRFLRRSSNLCFVFSLTALILYIPANLLPFMTIQMLGERNSSTIWSGIVQLINEKSYIIALIIFLASVLFPLMKLMILFYLTLTPGLGSHSRFKTSLYRFVEYIGRWSMLDIFIVAILVALVKLGAWTRVKAEVGSVMFAMVVFFTMLASSFFDPRILWQKIK